MKDVAPNITHRDALPVGITWIDSMILFGPESKRPRQWIGVCHFSDKVYMFSPYDYQRPLMVKTLNVDPVEKWCSVAHECIYFDCPMNRFNKNVFISKFKDMGSETLGLPRNFGTVPVWYNDKKDKFHLLWGKLLYLFKCKPAGGELTFSEFMFNTTKDIL